MIKNILAGLLLLSPFCAANATLFSFDGNLTYHNDVATINFTLNSDATDVRVWTDSYDAGSFNMDPITAIWNASTGALLFQNDDNSLVDPATQTIYDSGFTFATLAAGDYFFTIANYDNFAAGLNISDGFLLDGQTPITTIGWNQPATGVLVNDYWHVQLDGVDSADDGTVPEPSVLALFGLGLLGMGFARKQKNK